MRLHYSSLTKLPIIAIFALLPHLAFAQAGTPEAVAPATTAATKTDAAPSAAAGITAPQLVPISFANLAERLLPAVVNISTTQKITGREDGFEGGLPEMPQFPPGSPFEEFFRDFLERHGQGLGPNSPGGNPGGSPGGNPDDAPENRPLPRKATSLGSGFVISADGYVVTNNHVIQDADEITVILQDNTNLKAELIGHDPKTDLALLRVKPKKPLAYVSFGDSDAIRVGDWVVAIGNPFGLGGTVTQGIISARARDINAGPYDDFLQTDASINRGNSGGPMFNLAGDVIGINTAIFSPTGGSVGIGFAIPANMAKGVIEQLKVHGKIKRGWIGVRIQQVTDEIAKGLALPKTAGALVSSVAPDSPAAKAKLEQGDVILTFDGKEVNEMRRLPRIVAETPVDKTVPLQVWRDGKTINLTIAVGELKDEEAEKNAKAEKDGPEQTGAIAELGITLSSNSESLAQKLNIDAEQAGLIVTKVQRGSLADEKNLRPGDAIVEAGNEPINTLADLQDKLAKAKAAQRPLLLLVERGEDSRWVALTLPEKTLPEKAPSEKAPDKNSEKQGNKKAE